MLKKVLVPIDGSFISFKALDYAIQLGKAFDSEIVVTHVNDPYDLSTPVDPKTVTIPTAEQSPAEKKKAGAAALAIAQKVNTLMQDPDTKIYFTRMDESNPKASVRAQLAEDAGADMLIGITADGGGQGLGGIRSFYNDRFFIRGFGNADMAVQLERDCAYTTGRKAEAVQAAGDTYELLKASKVPSAVVSVGNPDDAQDAADLENRDYLDSIAQGIVQAIHYGGQKQ